MGSIGSAISAFMGSAVASSMSPSPAPSKIPQSAASPFPTSPVPSPTVINNNYIQRPVDKEHEEREREKHWLDFEKQSNTALYTQLASDSHKLQSADQPQYMKICKPIAITVLIVSVLLLIYVIFTTIRNNRTKITAGVPYGIQPTGYPSPPNHFQPAGLSPAIAMPVTGGKGRGKKSSISKKLMKGAKKIMKKMKMHGGSCDTGGTCSCSQGFKY